MRKFGGVLEHPVGSLLWKKACLPAPGERDKYGGWTLPIHQQAFGHKTEKATLLYIVGCEPGDIPMMPFVMGEATHVVQSRKRTDYRPHISKAEREHTPIDLAIWLVELARRCKPLNIFVGAVYSESCEDCASLQRVDALKADQQTRAVVSLKAALISPD